MRRLFKLYTKLKTEPLKTDFRSTILFIYRNFKDKTFTLYDLSDFLRNSSDFYVTAEFRKKLSNSLRRLYQMGFLKRDRVVRKTLYGSKGFMYAYSLNRQGLSYCKHLIEENEIILNEDYIEEIVIAKMLKGINSIYWDIVLEFILSDSKAYNRFQSKATRIKMLAMQMKLEERQERFKNRVTRYEAKLALCETMKEFYQTYADDLKQELERVKLYNSALALLLLQYMDRR